MTAKKRKQKKTPPRRRIDTGRKYSSRYLSRSQARFHRREVCKDLHGQHRGSRSLSHPRPRRLFLLFSTCLPVCLVCLMGRLAARRISFRIMIDHQTGQDTNWHRWQRKLPVPPRSRGLGGSIIKRIIAEGTRSYERKIEGPLLRTELPSLSNDNISNPILHGHHIRVGPTTSQDEGQFLGGVTGDRHRSKPSHG